MTDPDAEHQSPRSELASLNLPAHPPDAQPDESHQEPPAFEPIFTLVNNTSNGTIHHPHVRYIFSDDDPDILTQALAECEASSHTDASRSEDRAMMLDLTPDDKGGYGVSWTSSLSPSWAILDAQLSHISPPSSDGGGGGGTSGEDQRKRPDRLMLRVEGVENAGFGSEVDMRLSGEEGRQDAGSRSGSGASGRTDSGKGELEDYHTMVEEFEKRLSMLRKVVDAGEDRRRKIQASATGPDATESQAELQSEETGNPN